MSIDTTIDRITNKIMSLISHYKDILNKIKMSNVLLNPVNIYNIKKDMLKIENKCIENIKKLNINNKIDIYVSDGCITSLITDIKEN